MRFRQRHTEFGDIERRLRDERTAPSDALRLSVSQLTSRRGDWRRHTALRLGLAMLLTAVMLATGAAVGSASYASNSAGNNVGQVKEPAKNNDSSHSQYGVNVIICLRVKRGGKGQTLRLPSDVAKLILRLFPFSTLGPC